MTIDSLNDIIKNYNLLGLPIINDNLTLNYSNFIKLIQQLSTIQKPNTHINNSKYIKNEKIKLIKIKKFNLYQLFNNKFKNFDNLYYLSKGIYKSKLLTNSNNNIDNKINNDIIINYLEGCNFIFDLYINNNIKNYNWYYKYEYAPYLNDIYIYLKDKNYKELNNIFD
jgi:5'-3' exonuclease